MPESINVVPERPYLALGVAFSEIQAVQHSPFFLECSECDLKIFEDRRKSKSGNILNKEDRKKKSRYQEISS